MILKLEWLLSFMLGKCGDIIASFHIFSVYSLINYPVIQRFVRWIIDAIK
jgi:hypothetical protein